jgi:hypothetical protein
MARYFVHDLALYCANRVMIPESEMFRTQRLATQRRRVIVEAKPDDDSRHANTPLGF